MCMHAELLTLGWFCSEPAHNILSDLKREKKNGKEVPSEHVQCGLYWVCAMASCPHAHQHKQGSTVPTEAGRKETFSLSHTVLCKWTHFCIC